MKGVSLPAIGSSIPENTRPPLTDKRPITRRRCGCRQNLPRIGKSWGGGGGLDFCDSRSLLGLLSMSKPASRRLDGGVWCSPRSSDMTCECSVVGRLAIAGGTVDSSIGPRSKVSLLSRSTGSSCLRTRGHPPPRTTSNVFVQSPKVQQSACSRSQGHTYVEELLVGTSQLVKTRTKNVAQNVPPLILSIRPTLRGEGIIAALRHSCSPLVWRKRKEHANFSPCRGHFWQPPLSELGQCKTRGRRR